MSEVFQAFDSLGNPITVIVTLSPPNPVNTDTSQTITGAKIFNEGTFIDKGNQVVDVRAFGAVGDGTTNDTAAIQAAINYMGASVGLGGGVLSIPNGEYLITDTLVVTRMAITIQGTGWANAANYPFPALGTVLKWGAAAGKKPMIKVRDSYGVTIDNIRFQGGHPTDSANVPSAAINFNRVAPDSTGSNGKLFVDRCRISTYPYSADSPRDHCVDVGILIDGDNGNNDEYVFSRCFIESCVVAGIKIVNSQSVWGMVRDTLIMWCPIGIDVAALFSSDNVQFAHNTLDYMFRTNSNAWITKYSTEFANQFMYLEAAASASVTYGDLDTLSLNAAVPMIDATHISGDMVLALHGVEFGTLSASNKLKMRAGGAGWISANEFPKLVVEDCGSISPANLDVTLLDTGDQRDVYWRSGSQHFFHKMRGSDGTLNVKAFDTDAGRFRSGTGSPEGAVIAPIGTMYLRSDGAASTTLYVKTSGTGNTGWTAK